MPRRNERGAAHLRNKWQKVVGDTLWVLANPAGLVRSNGIKVAQEDNVPLGVGLGEVAKDLLDKVLRFRAQ